jgi:hypothetical protein
MKGAMRMNCWEFKKCGREANGAKAKELGTCSAYPNHGTHCAKIAGTLCGGKVQRVAKKLPIGSRGFFSPGPHTPGVRVRTGRTVHRNYRAVTVAIYGNN